MMKPKRRGSMASAETSNYTAEVRNIQCTKNIEEISGKKTCSSIGCLKSKKGDVFLKKKKKIPDRWAEYLSELLEDRRKN